MRPPGDDDGNDEQTPTDLVPGPGPGGLARPPEATVAAARRYMEAGVADNTRRAYASDRRVYGRWCAAHAVAPVPAGPAVIALYATDLADGVVEGGRAHQWGKPRRPATVARHLVSIGLAHRAAGHASPCDSDEVQRVLEGIRRVFGARPRAKTAAVLETMRALVAAIGGDEPRDVRDRAMLLVGFWGALRRSELVDLRPEDMHREAKGVRIFVERSKTDQAAEGRWTAAARAADDAVCPARALDAWTERLAALARERGGSPPPTVFCSLSRRGWLEPMAGEGVAAAVKRAVERAGLDPAKFAGHSLRSGFVTSAGDAGVPLAQIAQKTGHRRLDTLRAYLHGVEGWEHDAGWSLTRRARNDDD